MAELKPAYLIHGDDHGAVAERRAGLRALAEGHGVGRGERGAARGRRATPAGVADALAAMTLAIGRRVIIVEGVERWRQADVEAELAAAMSAMPPETTVALFAREEGAGEGAGRRARGGQGSRRAGRRADDGQAMGAAQVGARAGRSHGADAATPAAAKALVAQVGDRQQRLLRELEKLALEVDARRRRPVRCVDAERIEARAAHSARVAGVRAGRRARRGQRTRGDASYLRLREQGERLSGPDLPDVPAPARGARGLAAAAGGGVRRRRSSAACACPRGPPSASSPTSRAATRAAARRTRRARRPGAGLTRRRGDRLAANPLAALGEDTLVAASDRPDRRLKHRGLATALGLGERAGGRRVTSCARRCCDAARRA